MPRRVPYTERGIRRVPCVKCGKPGYADWQICADGRFRRVVCKSCDIALNRMVLEWAGFSDVDEKMEAYERKIANA